MKNPKRRLARTDSQRAALRRPALETLEDRLPPGDALTGALLAGAWIGSGLSPAPERAAADIQLLNTLGLSGAKTLPARIPACPRPAAGTADPGAESNPSLASLPETARHQSSQAVQQSATIWAGGLAAADWARELDPLAHLDLLDRGPASHLGAHLPRMDAPQGELPAATADHGSSATAPRLDTGAGRGPNAPPASGQTPALGQATLEALAAFQAPRLPSSRAGAQTPATATQPATTPPGATVVSPTDGMAAQSQNNNPPPPPATGPPCTGYSLPVPADGNTYTTGDYFLQGGVEYTFVASGDVQIQSSPPLPADAEYYDFTNPQDLAPDGTDVGLKQTGLDPFSGSTPTWGPYRPDHTYYLNGIADATGPAGFRYVGVPPYATTGSLSVEIYCGRLLPPPVPPACNCSQNSGLIDSSPSGTGGDSPDGFSSGPVRYADGTMSTGATDLSSAGFGVGWGQTRTWTNNPGYEPTGVNGTGVVDTQLPYLLQGDNGTLVVVRSGTSALYFDLSGGVYAPRYFDQDRLAAGTGEYVLTDTQGDQLHFATFSGVPAYQAGQLLSFVDPAGNQTTINRGADGKPTSMVQTVTADGVTTTDTYTPTYIPTGQMGAGQLAKEVLKQTITGTTTTNLTVRKVKYAYYNPGDAFGNAGNLKTVTVLDGADNVLDTTYYRYYTPADSDYSNGYRNGLKMVFSGPSFARLQAAVSNPFTAADAAVRPYADDTFQYDGLHRVTDEVVQGAGDDRDPTWQGRGHFTFQYTLNPSTTAQPGYNSWSLKTVETLPDGNQNIVYTNAYGQVMLHDFVNPANANQRWVDFYKYDNAGRLVLHAQPSAIQPDQNNPPKYYDDTFVEPAPASAADLLKLVNGNYVYLNDSAGLIETTTYYTSTTATEPPPPDLPTAGGVAGYVQDTFLQQGELGGAGAVKQSHTDYWLHRASAQNGGATVYPVADSWVYTNNDGTGGRQTSYSYSWQSNVSGLTTQMQSMQTTLPVVSAAQHGPATAATTTTVYDSYGRAVWTQDAGGFIGYTAYDQATGAVIKTIQDVKIDAQHAPDYDNQTPPTGWMTPANGGLHLITRMAVDTLGRTTKLTDPKGNVTYTVYLDAAHAVRTYRGWVDPLTSTPYTTGPTEVSQEVWPAAGSGSPLFEETLTASTPPAIDGNRQPTGGEPITIGDIQSWSRQYTDNAGQVVRTDAYVNKTGIAAFSAAPYLPTNNPGTSTNYYTSYTDYDSRGRASRQQSAAGTVTVTNYDGLGRVTSHSVGTSDANQVVTDQNQYDGGGVGDSTLTQVTQYVVAGDLTTARVTQNFYDWRDRLVAAKSGAGQTLAGEDTGTHRPLTYQYLDNLGEVTEAFRYDADQITIPGYTNGVPNLPLASRLRAATITQYDDQGRAYLSEVFSVSTTGTISPYGLTTNWWYDLRGNPVKESAPGGQVTKTQYDGAGRPYVSYVTNEVANPSWAEANSVAGNLVLTQTETTYDADGNPTLVTTRDRFHTETLTGPLSDPSGGAQHTLAKARASYVATYYDPANRTTATADFGTNAAQGPPTIGTTPPAPSDVVLVTKTSYLADTLQTVALTGGPTGGNFKLLLNSQPTGPINFNAGATDVQSALAGLVGLGNVLVTGPAGATGVAGGPWTVRFTGTLAGTSVALLTADPSGLTGGTMPNVAVSLLSQAGDAGRVQQVTDPRGLVQKTDYDLLGRSVRTVQAFSSAATPPANANTTTELTYDGDGHQLTLQADLANGTFQRTQSNYGITSPIASDDVLASVQYPDKNTGLPSTQPSDREVYGYNVQGDMTSKTDRNGTAHAYTLDVLGRQTVDAVTIPMGSPVDTAVQRLETAYDTYGNASLFTSYSATSGGTMVNQVQRTYNGFGQLTAESQNHGGTTPTYTVQYGYNATSSGINYSRLVSMTYPNGRVLTYTYGAGGSLDDQISRLTAIADSSGTLESYTDNTGVSAYLGLSTVVQRSHPQAALDLTYYQAGGAADAGDPYVGLDRFGRVVNQLWVQNGGATDSFQYGYDRDGNRVYRDNLLKPTFGEIYHAAGVVDSYDGQGNLATLGYDPLNEIAQFNRGTLTTDKTNLVGAASQNQAWSYDALGNWTSFTNGASTDNRSHNQQNQITGMAGGAPTYDNNGNTTQYANSADGLTRDLVYDAWNRLVKVTNGATTLATYGYDALGRRIQEAEANAFGDAVTRDLYFSAQWQVLEEHETSASYTNLVRAQYVWSPVYVDALVERDRDPARNGSGMLSERFYVQQDANFNVTGLVTSAGAVAERYVYDPFGNATIYDSGWNISSTTSQYGWVYLHQGGRYDASAGTYNFQNRDFSPTLGRWIEEDPLGYKAGDLNLYRGLGNNLPRFLDPNGFRAIPVQMAAFIPGRLGTWLPEPAPGSSWYYKSDGRDFGGDFRQSRVRSWFSFESLSLGKAKDIKVESEAGVSERRKTYTDYTYWPFYVTSYYVYEKDTATVTSSSEVANETNGKRSTRVTVTAAGHYPLYLISASTSG